MLVDKRQAWTELGTARVETIEQVTITLSEGVLHAAVSVVIAVDDDEQVGASSGRV